MASTRPVPLNFIVVGASVAGFASAYALKKAGHNVSLIDASDKNPSMSTAILAVPTAMKILQQWGLNHLLENIAEPADHLQYLDGETGRELSKMPTNFFEPLRTDAAAEFISLPDKELRKALYELAKKEGVIFRFNTKVVDVEPGSGMVTLADGEQLSADLIIAADGFYSFFRKYVVDEDEEAEEANGSQKIVFISVSLPLNNLLVDETLLPLSSPTLWTFWLGDGFIGRGSVAEHEQIYSLSLEFVYNGVVAPEDKHWREVNQSELGRFGVDFDKLEERLRILINSGNQVLVKVFTNKRPTDSVVCHRSRCILVGEAAHSLTPGDMHTTGLYLEDAQILGSLFSRIQNRTQIGRFTTAYDDIRQPRTSSLLKFIEKSRVALMAPKGHVRDVRDKKLSELRDPSETDDVLNEWMSFATQFANDMVEDWWSKYGASLVTVPERRYSVLSNMEISVAKKTQSECPLPSISS